MAKQNYDKGSIVIGVAIGWAACGMLATTIIKRQDKEIAFLKKKCKVLNDIGVVLLNEADGPSLRKAWSIAIDYKFDEIVEGLDLDIPKDQ